MKTDPPRPVDNGVRIFAHHWTLFPVMDAVGAARFAAANGFQGLELQCNRLDFWPGLIPGATLAELAAIGRDEGLAYSLYGCDTVNAATGLPELRALGDETIERLLDVANRIGCQVLCLHAGKATELEHLERKGVPYQTRRYDAGALRQAASQRAVAAIAQWAELAAACGVTLVIENDAHVRHTAAPSARALAAMVRAIDRPNVRVNFDTGHAFIGGGLVEELAVLRPLIGHVHLDDNSTPHASEHLPLGEGAIDFGAIADFLASTEAALALEIYAPLRPVEATLASRAHLLAALAHGRDPG